MIIVYIQICFSFSGQNCAAFYSCNILHFLWVARLCLDLHKRIDQSLNPDSTTYQPFLWGKVITLEEVIIQETIYVACRVQGPIWKWKPEIPGTPYILHQDWTHVSTDLQNPLLSWVAVEMLLSIRELLSYSCHTNHYKLRAWKRTLVYWIILLEGRLRHRNHWAHVQVSVGQRALLEDLEEIDFTILPALEDACLPWLMAAFLHLPSQWCRIKSCS